MQDFNQLELICLYRKKPTGLDFSKFPCLTHLYVNEKIFEEVPVEIQKNLKYLDIRNILQSDLALLKNCIQLERLEIFESRKLVTLNGLEYLSKLKELEVGYCPILLDISAISNLDLSRMLFMNNKKINNYNYIGSLAKLHKLQIFNCAPIEHLNFLSNLLFLEFLVITETKILSEDNSILSLLNSIKYLYITPEKIFKKYLKGV